MSTAAATAARSFSLPHRHLHPYRLSPLLQLCRSSLPTSLPYARALRPKLHSFPFSSFSVSLDGSTPPPGKGGAGSIEWDHIPRTVTADPISPGDVLLRPGSGHLTVVLLGWLGASQRHMRKYADMYRILGVSSVVRFVVPLKGLVGIDLGRRVEMRAVELSEQLAVWCQSNEDRGLLFHTFSNTGWLAYGVILANLQSRIDITKTIKGCIVDSGPSAEISPEVWAAGFSAAILKKSSSTYFDETGNSKQHDNSWSEIFLFSTLRKFFEIVLRLPEVTRRLDRIISFLSKNQPFPQLYLYSSADKVIPSESVERFIQDQKSLGRTVFSHNFVTTPHVDHYRSYPHVYSTKISEFLKIHCPSAA